MKKTIIKAIICIMLVFALMFAEYRYIMCNQRPYIVGENLVDIEIFGYTDEYYAEWIK